MKDMDFADLKLFITGPTLIRREIRESGMLPEFGHRDAENIKRFKPIMENLRRIAKIEDEFQPVIYNGSGSTAMDSSIRSLVADGETVLNVSVGAFGDLYHKLAVVNGKKAAQLKFEPGLAIDPDRLDAALSEHKPAVVTFTHNETSTGVINDITAVCRQIRDRGAMPLVDGVSIFGGVDVGLKDAGCAMYVTSTQKSLALPAGFGIGFVSPEAEEKASAVANRGHASDILLQLPKARINQTLTTPNCTLANQMRVQLDYIVNEEGVDNRFARHVKMRDMVHDFVEGLGGGWNLFAPEGRRSPTVTTVQVPEGVTVDDLKALKERMRARGFLFDPGYGKINVQFEKEGGRPVFRIGHMGDVAPDMLSPYLEALKSELPG